MIQTINVKLFKTNQLHKLYTLDQFITGPVFTHTMNMYLNYLFSKSITQKKSCDWKILQVIKINQKLKLQQVPHA